jgi:hypothetical protein
MMFTGIDRTTGRARPDRTDVMASAPLHATASRPIPVMGGQLRKITAAAMRALLTVPVYSTPPSDAAVDALRCRSCRVDLEFVWIACGLCSGRLCLESGCLDKHKAICKAVNQ